MTIAQNYLSCTGASAWERGFPADRSFRLSQGGGRCVGGYRVENSMNIPMAFWVGKRGGDANWWTLSPGESIRFNARDGAYIMATTAEPSASALPP